MSAGSHIIFDLGNLTRSAIAGLSLVLKFGLDFYILPFWLEMYAHFGGVLGAYFPQISVVLIIKRTILARKHVHKA